MFEPPVQRLIDEFARLPGVGQKSAQRLAFHLLNAEDADARRLADAIIEMKAEVRLCNRCFNVTAEDECSICLDVRRDPSVVCVVERAQDIPVIERTQEFRGRYHVLGGAISPIAGIGPETLRMKELVARVDSEGITEISEAGPVFHGETYEVDLLIYATGFEVQKTGIYNQIVGKGGLDLEDKYADGIRTVLGIHTHGFPNLFIMGGYQASFQFNLTDMLQTQGDHIAECIDYVRRNGLLTMDPTDEAEEWWVQEVIKHRGKTSRNRDCTPGYYNNEHLGLLLVAAMLDALLVA